MFKTMAVTYVDGTEKRVHGRKADVVRFERRFAIPASTMFEEGIWTERMWFFAWCADGREGDVPEFDEWIELVEKVEVVTEEAEQAPPTDPDSSPTP